MTMKRNDVGDVEVKRVFMEQLPCSLDESELANIARKIGAKRGEILELEAKKRQTTEHFKALIDGAQASADSLAAAAHTGIETREVQCAEAFVWATGRVEVRRKDTGDIVRERAMTPEERQSQMPWAPPKDDATPKGAKRAKAKGIPMLPAAEHDRKDADTSDDPTVITDPEAIVDGMPPEEKPKAKRKSKAKGKKK